jgi:SAM-dependent methyltransferase
MMQALRVIRSMLNYRALAVRWSYCPLCDGNSVLVKLDNQHVAVRCVRCRASAVTLSLISVLKESVPDLDLLDVYELSARGPLFAYLQKHAKTVTFSEYFSNVPPGEYQRGIQCQDVQRLTYRDDSFDLCTSTEVFEHVPDDRRGFAEICRVLRPGGRLIFTVPLEVHAPHTVERAKLLPDGSIEHLLEPEYHGDPIRADGRILAFRNYGADIVDRLRTAGFRTARLAWPRTRIPWAMARPVVLAEK